MERQRLTDGLKMIAFGYLLLHLNINLGTCNVLPNWLGYLLILKALPILGEYEPSALLLTPIGTLLAVWEGALWGMALFSLTPDIYLLRVVASVIALYFHFQLLTNLADIAQKFGCKERRSILMLRTVRTILITLVALPIPWESIKVLSVWIAIIYVFVAIWICVVLFSFRRSLNEESLEPH